MVDRAAGDEASTGLMGHRGDYSLLRVIEIHVLSAEDGHRMADARRNSGWPILPFEKELHGTLQRLVAAFVPPNNARIATSTAVVDLEPARDEIAVAVPVRRLGNEAGSGE
jgi:hypothetical protein